MRILLLLLLSTTAATAHSNDKSICFGSTDNGRLERGWQLPSSGSNYEAYSLMGIAMGRTYVHSSVYTIVVDAYEALSKTSPEKVFVYGETGWKHGGKFKPHKTHQNGLSVDFFVPVINSAGESVALPTSPLNKFGYNIEFSSQGQYKEYSIDFDAMAEHLLALKASSDKQGIKIWRVIFDNDLQRLLFTSKKGQRLKGQLQFSTKRPWVRHDEHYHVDFIVPCQHVG